MVLIIIKTKSNKSGMSENFIWVFSGEQQISGLPSAVFSTKDKAESWIKHKGLSGTLTKYPVDISVYDWAVDNNYFTPKNELQKNAKAVQNFTSAYLEHYHYKDGM